MIPVQVPNDIDEMQDATTTTTTSPLLTPLLLQQTLALSMGIILARAAMQPSASAQGEIAETKATTWEIQIVLPKAELWGGIIANLDWMHYEPWPGNVISGAGMSEHLVTYSIAIGNPSGTEMDVAAAAAAEDQVAKRQKRGDDTTSLDNSIDDTDVNELAHAVAQFLLETNAMSWFLRPGGVLLFLLSLVQTRTIPTLQSDMDDATAKLTSNFGHCSQELINLLLTGQSGKSHKQPQLDRRRMELLKRNAGKKTSDLTFFFAASLTCRSFKNVIY
jgi:ubiquitin carboxyl-terminal hydrolase MINDY-3/4